MKRHYFRICLISAGIIGLTGCINLPYQAPTQQGNVLEANRANLVKVGMSKAQVANAIGTPIVQDVFHQNRWDYVYRLDEHTKMPEQQRITVWFNNDTVSKIERHELSKPQ